MDASSSNSEVVTMDASLSNSNVVTFNNMSLSGSLEFLRTIRVSLSNQNNYIRIQLPNEEILSYRTSNAKAALAFLHSMTCVDERQDLTEYMQYDLTECTARLILMYPELSFNPQAAKFIALMTKAEAYKSLKEVFTSMTNDMAKNKITLPDMTSEQHEWRDSLSHNAFTRIAEEGLVYSGSIMWLLAESLRLCIYDTERTSTMVPIVCNQQEHENYIQQIQKFRVAIEATSVSSTKFEVGVCLEPGSITPTCAMSGLGGAVVREKFRHNIATGFNGYLRNVRKLHKNSLEATTDMHFNPESINPGSYDFIITNETRTIIIRGNASGSGLHAVLSCDHISTGSECKKIFAKMNDTNSTFTMYKLDDHILKKAISIDKRWYGDRVNWETVNTTQNAFTYCFGDIAKESGVKGGSWKFAKNGIEDRNPKEGFALATMKDMLMGSMLRYGGSALGILMHYPNIFYKNGDTFKLLHLMGTKATPIFVRGETLIHITGKMQAKEWNEDILTC